MTCLERKIETGSFVKAVLFQIFDIITLLLYRFLDVSQIVDYDAICEFHHMKSVTVVSYYQDIEGISELCFHQAWQRHTRSTNHKSPEARITNHKLYAGVMGLVL
jgi:hypothetical protein